jgi:leucyl-tRNA synthetase
VGALKTLVLLLAPTAPHLAEELWRQLGEIYSIHNQAWPVCDEELAKEEEIIMPVQINGKLRDRLVLVAADLEALTMLDEVGLLDWVKERSRKIAGDLVGKTVVKTIYKAGQIFTIVVR